LVSPIQTIAIKPAGIAAADLRLSIGLRFRRALSC
jgi:hypothetical protein